MRITERFIAKAEAKFNSQQVDIREFENLLSEWGTLVYDKCYVNQKVKQTYLQLNHLKLTIEWFLQERCSNKNEQLQHFLQCLIQYIGIELESLSLHSETTDIQGTQKDTISWTAYKRSLIELVCALHAAKCINGGKITLQKTVALFEQFLDINISNLYPELNKMATRKPLNDSFKRAYFINELADKFNERMLRK